MAQTYEATSRPLPSSHPLANMQLPRTLPRAVPRQPRNVMLNPAGALQLFRQLQGTDARLTGPEALEAQEVLPLSRLSHDCPIWILNHTLPTWRSTLGMTSSFTYGNPGWPAAGEGAEHSQMVAQPDGDGVVHVSVLPTIFQPASATEQIGQCISFDGGCW